MANEQKAAVKKPAARVVKQNDRAADGLTRFKIRADAPTCQPVKYILAADEADAKAEYLRVMRLAADAVLVVTQLPD